MPAVPPRVRRLLQRKHRLEAQRFLAEGPHVVSAAFDLGADVELVLTSDASASADIDAVVERAARAAVTVMRVDAEALREIAETVTPQPVVAVVALPAPSLEEQRAAGTWLLLDAVRDPGNVGTLLRAAEAFGAAGVLATKGTADLWSGKVVRSAQGAHFGLTLVAEAYEQGDVASLVEHHLAAGGGLWAATLDGGSVYDEHTVPERLVLALGNETQGVGAAVADLATRNVTVPQSGRSDSLNVAMAGSILLSWVQQCRGIPGVTDALPDASGSAQAASTPSVEAIGLTKAFGKHVAVRGIDLRVEPGELFGFVGPNGAGKSTTIRMLCGLLRPTSGMARVLGYDVAQEPLEVKRRVGVLPEEVDTYERLTGRELLIFTGRIHGLARDEAVRRSDELLDLVELDADDRRRMVVDYSMGMRKKTVLACALIHNPRVLFLDEPFNGIDAVTTQALQAVLARLVEHGVTIFFSSHVLDVVERMCTRLGIVHQGQLVASGTLDEIRAQTGKGAGRSLQDIFVDVVGGRVERGGLEWLG